MKGGKDDEKIMGPLFPRLHVNDAEKGGPRAPPRNKMALYEQFSIPSQKKFNSGATSTLPLSSNNPSNLVPTASSSQGVGQERNMFSTFYISPPHSHSFENFRSHSHDGANSNTTRVDFEQTCSETRHLSSTAEFSSFHPDNFSKDSQNNGDEDDCRVPTFVRSETIPCGNGDQHDIDKQEFTTFRPPNPGSSTVTPRNSPLEPAASTFMSQIDVCDKPLKRTSSKVQKARQDMRNQRKENQTTRDFLEKPGSHPISRKNIGEPLKHADAASSQEHGDDPVDDLGRLYNVNAKIHQEAKNVLLPERTTNNEGITAEPVRRIDNGNVLMVMGGSCPGASFGDDNRGPKGAENGSGCHEAHGSLQIGDLDRCDDISETSMVDSISGLGISPDDVVGIIGQKHFWKARRAIASQQRVFAVQVFELHRLIKVQRLIAASPHLLLEDCDYFGNHSLDSSHAKKFPSEHIIKRPPQIVKQKDSEPPNQATEIADNKAVQKSCLTPHSDIIKGPINQHSIFGPYSSKPPPVAIDYKAGPWCFPQPGNQWLVPIMSPSDGLVYKPYSGPCPPTAGFMAPVYGGYVPPSLPPMAGDFMSTAYGVPAPHQQGSRILKGAPPVGHAYTPQYGIPVINRATSGSAVKAMSSFSRAQPHGQADRLSTGDVNFDTYYQASCNISSQKSAAMSCHVGKLQPSKDSEILGSTSSSLSERAQGAEAGHEADGGDALPLFPMVPSFQVSDQSPQPHSNEQQTLVIKVVPHNPRSATESAARIFRSIQEERRHSDTA